MTAPAAREDAGTPPEGAEGATEAAAGGVIAAFLDVVRDGFALAAAEARRAGVGLAVMIALALAAALLLVTVWLLLAAAAVVALTGLGVPAPGALLIVAAANLAGAAVLGFGVLWWSRRLLFTATRRQLAGGRRGRGDDAASDR